MPVFVFRYIHPPSWSLIERERVGSEMEMGDKAVGLILSVVSVSIFTYYTFWVIILPFVESDHFVHSYFPPQEYAILIPVAAGVALLALLFLFVGYVMFKSKNKKKKNKSA